MVSNTKKYDIQDIVTCTFPQHKQRLKFFCCLAYSISACINAYMHSKYCFSSNNLKALFQRAGSKPADQLKYRMPSVLIKILTFSVTEKAGGNRSVFTNNTNYITLKKMAIFTFNPCKQKACTVYWPATSMLALRIAYVCFQYCPSAHNSKNLFQNAS